MKTLVLSSVLFAGLLAAAPASAQFASTGDGIFGHDYRSYRNDRAARNGEAKDLSIGYSETVSGERTGSVEAVSDQVRRGKAELRAPADTARDADADRRR